MKAAPSRLHHDDDVEVYLDGQLVLKRAGWTTSYRLFELPSTVGRLAAGEHVLAIHCHQNRGGQYIDAGFTQVVEPTPPRTSPARVRSGAAPASRARRAGGSRLAAWR